MPDCVTYVSGSSVDVRGTDRLVQLSRRPPHSNTSGCRPGGSHGVSVCLMAGHNRNVVVERKDSPVVEAELGKTSVIACG